MDIYYEVLLEEAENPRNQGTLPAPAVSHRSVTASCGDQVTIYLELDEKKRISNIKWTGTGCVISQAAMSVLSDALIGKDTASLADMGLVDMLALLKFDSISPGRIKCCMLGLVCAKEAVALHGARTL